MLRSNAPVRFLSHPPPSMRGGISIKTATFVQLLKQSHEWDRKYPQLRRAQESYLLESFSLGDDFCSLASQSEIEHWQIPFIIQGRVFTKCLLLAVVFFATALIMPSVARAQEQQGIRLDVWPMTDDGLPQNLHYQICNESDNFVDTFSLSEMKTRPWYDWFQSPPGWEADISWFGDGTSAINWVSQDGQEIQPAQCLNGFVVWGPTENFVQEIDYLIGGGSGVAWGKTWGHASY